MSRFPARRSCWKIDGTAGERVVFQPFTNNYWEFNYTLIVPSTIIQQPNSYTADPITLTETGTHRLAISPNPGNNGSELKFALATVDQVVELQAGGRYEATLEPGKAIELYRIAGAQGRVLGISGSMTTGANDYTEWLVYGPDDEFLTSRYAFGVEKIQIDGTFAENGDYLLVVRSTNPERCGAL